MRSAPLLTVEEVSVSRAGRIVLEPCSVSVRPGEVVVVYGPNGAGKSTLLQSCAGLLPLTAGHVVFAGQTLGQELSFLEYHRRTAAVFQEPLLLRGTVQHNVGLGLALRGLRVAEQQPRVRHWMRRLKIEHLADRPIGALSGGEAQRVSLARALVLDPQCLFLDEPFAALDAPTRHQLVADLADILQERHIATLFVTHDLSEALELGDRGVVIDQGRILQQGDFGSLLQKPQSRRVAEIMGTENILEVTVIEASDQSTWCDWAGLRLEASTCHVQAGAKAIITVRQESLRVRPPAERADANALRGRIEKVRPRLHGSLVTLRVGNGQALHATCAADFALSQGDEAIVTMPPPALHTIG